VTKFSSEVVSLLKTTQMALHVDYSAQGSFYWKYDEETLDERRRRYEQEV
jgi:hypothetical protein